MNDTVIRNHYRVSIADAGDLVARIVRLVDMQSKPLTASALAKLAEFHVGER